LSWLPLSLDMIPPLNNNASRPYKGREALAPVVPPWLGQGLCLPFL